MISIALKIVKAKLSTSDDVDEIFCKTNAFDKSILSIPGMFATTVGYREKRVIFEQPETLLWFINIHARHISSS